MKGTVKNCIGRAKLLAGPAAALVLSACTSSGAAKEATAAKDNNYHSGTAETVSAAVDFDHELDRYTSKKDHYNFYFTYKTVHPWWDRRG
mgnify:CR=1 FL=1